MNAAERRIRAYEAMGDHRTGRAADNAATGWMIAELASVGVHAEPQEWTFPQVDWDDASVRINGTSVPGVPLFDGALTSVSGNLAEPGSSGIVVSPIAHGDGTQFSQAMYPHLNTLREGGAAAVVLVMGDPTAITPSATPSDRSIRSTSPSSRSRPTTQPRCSRARPGRKRRSSQSRAGARPRTPPTSSRPSPEPIRQPHPVTLMTPKSGWYTCAAERGGGIAIWMEVAGRVAAEPGRRSLNIVASSGHELHHLGLEHYISELGQDAANVHTWMHLGASIGSRNGQPAYAASDDELFNVATTPLRPPAERRAFPVGNAGFGEARNIGEIGGRFVSFLGGHPYFHSPSDTYDRCIDPESLASHTDAVERIIRYMLQ